MGRKRTIDLEKYVTVDEQNIVAKCLLCHKNLCLRVGNIKRHYKIVHNYTRWHNVQTVNDDDLRSSSSVSSISRRKSNVSIHLNKNEFLLCCVGLVTVKNLPLEIFDDEEYFKKILLPFEDTHGTNLNSKNIQCEIETAAYKIKESISKSVSKKMICLKIDLVTCVEKSILGVNIQYIKNSKVITNTIGIIQLNKRPTVQFVKEEILNCLKEFNINISQVYTCVFDNGADFIETPTLFQDLSEEPFEQQVEYRNNDDKDFESIYSALLSIANVVICPARTFQLAVQDVFKIIEFEIEECRKILSKFSDDNITNFEMTLIDDAKKWNSPFQIIQSLAKLYSLKFEDLNSLEFVSDEFNCNFVTNFINAFKPVLRLTDKFGFEQYIVGDFYRDWLSCEVELEELENEGNIYAKKLIDAMGRRKQSFLTNEAIISAIYLDPRFNFTRTPFLSEEQKTISVNHLLKTQEMIKKFDGQNTEVPKASIISRQSTSTGRFSKLEAKINFLIQQTAQGDQLMKRKLEDLSNEERVPFETNILDFLKNIKNADAELEKILDVALAVPSTQVTVRNAFSALSNILTNMRNLSKDSISKMFLVKLNENLI